MTPTIAGRIRGVLGVAVLGVASGLCLASALVLGGAPLTAAGTDAVLVGAGDIAQCGGRAPESSVAAATARLLDRIEGAIFTVGDEAYDGTAEEFQNCFGPTWGRHKARIRPSPGNHEYYVDAGAPYYAYFGPNAGAADLGYYSYRLGAWHIASLNSNIPAHAGSAQEQWLRADLAANRSACTLAYWHHPRFSSGRHGDTAAMRDTWRVLYQFAVNVVINGHDHDYERFAPQDPDQRADPERGIRQFVVGTGGAGLHPFHIVRPNSEVRNNSAHGVLKLTLHPMSYDWEFIPIAGQQFRDVGSASCVRRNSARP